MWRNANTDPFQAHLISLLSIYELGSLPPCANLPHYDGPRDWQTETIFRSLSTIAKRMWAAEEALAAGTTTTMINGKFSEDMVYGDDFDRITMEKDKFKAEGDDFPSNETPSSDLTLNMPTWTVSAHSTTDSAHFSSTTKYNQLGPDIRAFSTHTYTQNINPSRQNFTSNTTSNANNVIETSPLLVSQALAGTVIESPMAAAEELKLLKSQLGDIARVCNAVARGNLSHKITVPVHGVVMVQLKDVVNTMVSLPSTGRCVR